MTPINETSFLCRTRQRWSLTGNICRQKQDDSARWRSKPNGAVVARHDAIPFPTLLGGVDPLVLIFPAPIQAADHNLVWRRSENDVVLTFVGQAILCGSEVGARNHRSQIDPLC